MTRTWEKKNAKCFWREKLKGRDRMENIYTKQTNIKMGLTK